jgi:antitoxin component YwqK of YwqJK toxin-antitoxin module
VTQQTFNDTTVVREFDRLHRIHGKSYVYCKDKLKAEYSYTQDTLNGWTTHWNDESITQTLYIKNVYASQITTYIMSGATTHYNYTEGKLHGLTTIRSSNDGIEWITYHQDKQHGKQYEWLPDGSLKSIHNYKNGSMCGLQRRFHANGRKYQEYHVSHTDSVLYNVVANGSFREWPDTGQLTISKCYDMGKEVN